MPRILLLCFLVPLVLSGCTRDQPTVPPEGGNRIQELAVQAALGDRLAQYNLAVEFYRGEDVPQDYTRAAALWNSAAAQGDVDAKNNLAFLLFHGLGVAAEPERALSLWREAAAAGQVESHWQLGLVARDGLYQRSDLVEAYARIRAASLLGGQSPDEVDRDLAGEARREADLLGLRLRPGDLRAAEARAQEYASVGVHRRDVE